MRNNQYTFLPKKKTSAFTILGLFLLVIALMVALSAAGAAVLMLLLGVVLGGTAIGGPAFTTTWAFIVATGIVGTAWHGSSNVPKVTNG